MATSTYPAGFKKLQGGGYAVEVESKGANYTVTREDSGKVFVSTAADLVFTLPATEKGLTYTFVTKVVSAGTGTSVSPQAADKIIATGFTSADDKDAVNTGATDTEGDSITLVGDGLDGWIEVGRRGIWARQA
jgi:hypothetical protein